MRSDEEWNPRSIPTTSQPPRARVQKRVDGVLQPAEYGLRGAHVP